MFLMSSWSVNSLAAYLQGLIKATGHRGAVLWLLKYNFHLSSSALPLVLLQQHHLFVSG